MDPPGVGLETFPAEVLEELPAVAVASAVVVEHGKLAPAVGVGLETEPTEPRGSRGVLALVGAVVGAGVGAVVGVACGVATATALGLVTIAVGKLPGMA